GQRRNRKHHEQHDQHLGHREVVDPDDGGHEIPPDPQHDHHDCGDAEHSAHNRFGYFGPSGSLFLAGSPVDDKAHECHQDHKINHGHLGRHHPKHPQERMMGSAHFSSFFQAGDQRV